MHDDNATHDDCCCCHMTPKAYTNNIFAVCLLWQFFFFSLIFRCLCHIYIIWDDNNFIIFIQEKYVYKRHVRTFQGNIFNTIFSGFLCVFEKIWIILWMKICFFLYWNKNLICFSSQCEISFDRNLLFDCPYIMKWKLTTHKNSLKISFTIIVSIQTFSGNWSKTKRKIIHTHICGLWCLTECTSFNFFVNFYLSPLLLLYQHLSCFSYKIMSLASLYFTTK